MKAEKKYMPINCSYYDRLEAWATTKQTCDITYKTSQSTASISTKILDLELIDGVEYLLGESGFQLRLDDLVSINGVFLEESKCEF